MEASVSVEYCGVQQRVDNPPFTIGRDADLVLDEENLHLHRRLVSIDQREGIWILANVGSRLTATVSNDDRRLEAFIAPGAVLPLVFSHNTVRVTAGPTTYEFVVGLDVPTFSGMSSMIERFDTPVIGGDPTIGRVVLTPDQLKLVVAIAEPALLRNGRTSAAVPTSGDAACRLGWAITKFNRKLDNVCQKLSSRGVRGLHGGPGNLALNRKARLVEYALAVGLVSEDDLKLLDDSPQLDDCPQPGAG